LRHIYKLWDCDKTLELISLERRRDIYEDLGEEEIAESIKNLCKRENRQVATANNI
jgi:hypothetical protein